MVATKTKDKPVDATAELEDAQRILVEKYAVEKSYDILVIRVPITSSLKIDLQALCGISYSNAMPSVTQADVQIMVALDVPESGWKPGDSLRDDQVRLRDAVLYAAAALDEANVMRVAQIVKKLTSELQEMRRDEL